MLLKYRQLNFSEPQEGRIEGQWSRNIEGISEYERHVKIMARKFKLRKEKKMIILISTTTTSSYFMLSTKYLTYISAFFCSQLYEVGIIIITLFYG